MPRHTHRDRHDRQTHIHDLYEHLVESPPQHRLDDIYGLDDLVEKARQVLVGPHRAGHTAAAGNTALVQTRPRRGETRLPTAIAGELCDAGFQFARIDLESQEFPRRHRNQEGLTRFLDAIVEEQPFVVLVEHIETLRGANQGRIQQRLTELSRGDDEVVLIGIDESPQHHRQKRPDLEQLVDLTFSVPEPGTERRGAILEEELTEVATTSGLEIDESVGYSGFADEMDGFDATWVRTVAKRAVALAAHDGGERISDDHLSEAISQVSDELPGDRDSLFGRRRDSPDRFSAEVPDVTFDDVGGLDDTIDHIQTIVDIQQSHSEVYEQAGFSTSHGILLAGPPGTGKTLLAKAVANELDRTFLSVKGPELKHPYYGMTERRIRQLFETADEEAPAVVFFDEFDAIAGDRDTLSHDATQSLVATLLTELDGIEDREDLLVLAATNRRDAIDDAVLRRGRFEEVIDVPVPDAAGKREIFTIHSDGVPLADAVTPEWFVSRAPDRLTGADISSICKRAFHTAVGEADSEDDIEVTRDHVRAAIRHTTSSGDREGTGHSFA